MVLVVIIFIYQALLCDCATITMVTGIDTTAIAHYATIRVAIAMCNDDKNNYDILRHLVIT